MAALLSQFITVLGENLMNIQDERMRVGIRGLMPW